MNIDLILGPKQNSEFEGTVTALPYNTKYSFLRRYKKETLAKRDMGFGDKLMKLSFIKDNIDNDVKCIHPSELFLSKEESIIEVHSHFDLLDEHIYLFAINQIPTYTYGYLYPDTSGEETKWVESIIGTDPKTRKVFLPMKRYSLGGYTFVSGILILGSLIHLAITIDDDRNVSGDTPIIYLPITAYYGNQEKMQKKNGEPYLYCGYGTTIDGPYYDTLREVNELLRTEKGFDAFTTMAIGRLILRINDGV